MSKEYSFIIEFDEMTDEQMIKLNDFVNTNEIKFHVLKSNYEMEQSEKQIEKLKKENVELKNQQKKFVKYLEDELKECNFHSKYIEKKVQEFKGKRVGKTYIANEIVKNECAKKQINKILSKYKEITGGENE